jgi:hypothetical protein
MTRRMDGKDDRTPPQANKTKDILYIYIFQNIINMPCGNCFLLCHMSNFNIWMTINDVSMTSWV